MISETRQQLLDLLTELSFHAPDMRLGQLLEGLMGMDHAFDGPTIYDIEDEDLVSSAKKLLDQLRGTRPPGAQSVSMVSVGASPTV